MTTTTMSNRNGAAQPVEVFSAEKAVRERYSAGASEREPALCCPVQYDPQYLRAIPDEIIERDYGCGDPTPYIQPGDTVLDLGSGGGKACYIAAQIVGRDGHVIGVDCNQDMLALARKYQRPMAEKLGYDVVKFRRGMIQDLQLDLDLLDEQLNDRPVSDAQGWLELRTTEEQLRKQQPMIASESVDCVVSNCVLNLVRPEDRVQLFREVFRVLRKGGRAAISDIVSDENVPIELQHDADLWSGCLSGAFQEDAFLQAFVDAGFHGIEIVNFQQGPWRTVEGIEFRSVTVMAHKGKQGPCLERDQALIYRGPFSKVEDDDGHIFRRGERAAVCDKTFHLLQRSPYVGLFEPVAPHKEILLSEAKSFDCKRSALRDPRETKGQNYKATTAAADCCGEGGC